DIYVSRLEAELRAWSGETISFGKIPHANASPGRNTNGPLHERRQALEEALGKRLFSRLLKANVFDTALYEFAACHAHREFGWAGLKRKRRNREAARQADVQRPPQHRLPAQHRLLEVRRER